MTHHCVASHNTDLNLRACLFVGVSSEIGLACTRDYLLYLCKTQHQLRSFPELMWGCCFYLELACGLCTACPLSQHLRATGLFLNCKDASGTTLLHSLSLTFTNQAFNTSNYLFISPPPSLWSTVSYCSQSAVRWFHALIIISISNSWLLLLPNSSPCLDSFGGVMHHLSAMLVQTKPVRSL